MNLSANNNYFLAGDIGATKTTLAIFPQGSLVSVTQDTVHNDTAASLEEIIKTFLDKTDLQPAAACFGIAGPVHNNRVRMTNLDWTIDGQALQNLFGLHSVTLVNDLVATSFGAVHQPSEALCTLNVGHPDPHGAVGVIAPGTGLGEAFLIRHNKGWLPVPSEGGHSAFAPVNEQQRQLLQFMAKQHTHISTEMVCSGIGIPNLYDFLCKQKGEKNLLIDEDRAKAVVETALTAFGNKEIHNTAVQTLQLFSAILASEAANLALKVLATGGLYIGGGIPPRILPFLQGEEFLHSFCKGEYKEMLQTIPIHVILEPKTALIGAAAYGQKIFGATGESA